MDLNTDTSVADRTPPIADVGSDRDQSAPRERVSVRDSLRQSFAAARQESERQDREAPVREPAEEPEAEPATEDTTPSDDREDRADSGTREAAGRAEPEEDSTEEKAAVAPTSWTKEARDQWESVPDRIRKEIDKREKDMERGVKAIKEKYKEIDEAITPYDPVIQEFGKTRGQAVGQMFAWFDALARNPDEAFPALVQSYKYEPKRLVTKLFPKLESEYNWMLQRLYQLGELPAQKQQQQGQNGQAQNGQAQNGQAQPVPVHPQVQAHIKQLQEEITGLRSQVNQHNQQFTGWAQHVEAQNAAQTQEMLDRWASDKPHFGDVRVMMGHLLTPDPTTGQAAIPLKDGRVDLDAAYEAAVYAMPEVRSKILAERQAQADAARKAKQEAALKQQQEKVAQAKKASGSLITSSPGAEVSRKGMPSKGVSVRDSLKQAINELSDR